MAKHSSARTELETFLNNLRLEVKPAIHVNGKDHPTAVVVVDFGAPLEAVRLNPEQSQDLAGKLRKFTRELVYNPRNDREVNVRVSSDNYLGVVYWASVQ